MNQCCIKDHHLLLHTPEGSLDKFMYEFNQRFALVIKKRSDHYYFSSLNFFVNKLPFSVPLHDLFGFKDAYVLSWLNK